MNLREIVNGIQGCEFAAIDTETAVTLRGGKSNPLQGRVTKRQIGGRVMIFSNQNINGYAAMVERRLTAEGKDPTSFQLSARKWGQREIGTPFVNHEGNEYIEVIFLGAGEITYLVDGVEYDGHIDGLPERKPEAEQGGLTNKVIIRTYGVESITAITCRGNTFVLDNNRVIALAA